MCLGEMGVKGWIKKNRLKRPFKKGLLAQSNDICANPLLNSGSYLGKSVITEEEDSLKVSGL